MQKSYYFANTTPPFSPPALAVETPTVVQTTTLKYLQPFLQERKLQDPLPASWRIPRATVDIEDLIEVPKGSIHLYDADSAEIELNNCDAELKCLATHGNHIRIRMKNHDAPETKYSVRIYRQTDEHSLNMSTFATRHIGIEALRAARQMIFEARTVYVQVERDAKGRTSVPLDVYRRRLVNIWLEDTNGLTTSFAQKLALKGFTMSFYTTGIDEGIDSSMRSAITQKCGMFSLPEEVFTYPYRPWEIRHLWSKKPEVFKEYRPILNPPQQPEVVWKPSLTDAPVYDDGCDGEWPDSQDGDSYFFRFVECKLQLETLCFKAQSTIGAGNGLFLKPHAGPIEQGDHICLYAEKSTTEAEINDSGSSRNYAMYISRKKAWFDAEIETGNNLGRFANQPMVLESLMKIQEMSTHEMPQLTEENWKEIENYIDHHCTIQFKPVGNQLVITAKVRLEATNEPKELFVNYGGLRNYWIRAIIENPDAPFPKEMKDIVHWLFDSPHCNWSSQQRREWAAYA